MKILTAKFWLNLAMISGGAGFAALFALSFMEASFFLLPVETLLIPLCFKRTFPEAMSYAGVGTAASVLGAMFGYFIGVKGGRPLLLRMFERRKVERVEQLLQKYDAWAIGIAAFTPIPYKVFTIAGGVCVIHFRRFVAVSLLARGARYAIIGSLVSHFSKDMELRAVEEFFESAGFKLGTIAVVAAIAAVYFGRLYISRRGRGRARPPGARRARQ
ncbi:MAG: VTT domain-containing protein [bacterium]